MKTPARWLVRIGCAALLLLDAASARAAEGRLDRWTVVGLRAAGEPEIREEVAVLRGALSLELSARGSGVVRDEEQTGLRLGLRGASLRSVRDRIDAAELYFFQLELGVARENLEQALEELGHASGIPEAWERTRAARMLLGMIHLASRDEAGKRLAAEQFAAVARIQPRWSPADASYPAEVVELYAEQRRLLDAGERGLLRVACEPACAGGHVFLDSFPVAVPGEAIALSPGRYRVVVTDRFENPQRRSLLHEVVVRPGDESRVTVDLAVEGSLSAEEGPGLGAARGTAPRRQAVEQVARRLGSDFVLALQAAEDGGWLAWVVDADGRIRRELALPPGAPGGVESIAHLALTDAMPGALAPVASVGQPLVAERGSVEAAAPATRADPVWTAARWGTGGTAVLAGALGLYLHLDGKARDEALRGQLRSWGGVAPSERAARATRSESDAIQSQARWGTGLLVGAGVLSATAITLFLLDPEAPEAAVRW